MTSDTAVPSELRTERLLLRPWRPDDASRLLPVLEANLAHLGPWIPARVFTPAAVPVLAERLAGFHADFVAAREWRYGLFTPDDAEVLGEVGLFPRSADGRVPLPGADRVEIGYWLRADVTGQGLATEAARAALSIAGALPGLDRAEIRCDLRNRSSAAVPQRLGFTLAETYTELPASPDEEEITMQLWLLPLAPRPAAAS